MYLSSVKCLTFKGVHLEARHLFGKDGLGKVQESWIIDRKVTVVLIQHPYCSSLDAGTQHRYNKKKSSPPSF